LLVVCVVVATAATFETLSDWLQKLTVSFVIDLRKYICLLGRSNKNLRNGKVEKHWGDNAKIPKENAGNKKLIEISI